MLYLSLSHNPAVLREHVPPDTILDFVSIVSLPLHPMSKDHSPVYEPPDVESLIVEIALAVVDNYLISNLDIREGVSFGRGRLKVIAHIKFNLRSLQD